MPSSQKLQIWLKPNCTWMFIEWSSTISKVFCSDMKFKMAATAELSLTLDPMGKMFQNASSLKPLGQLKPNCPGIIIWWSSKKVGFFMPIRNSRWLPPQVIVLTQDHMGKIEKYVLLWSYCTDWTLTVHQSLEGPLQTLCFLCWSEFQDDYHCRT